MSRFPLERGRSIYRTRTLVSAAVDALSGLDPVESILLWRYLDQLGIASDVREELNRAGKADETR